MIYSVDDFKGYKIKEIIWIKKLLGLQMYRSCNMIFWTWFESFNTDQE